MENTVPKIGFDLSGLEILIIGAKLGIGLSLAEVCAASVLTFLSTSAIASKDMHWSKLKVEVTHSWLHS